MKTFRVNDEIEVVCESQNTRYGFRHLATLLRNGQERETAKRCYYNRTWERYEFESVLETLLEKTKTLSTDEKALFDAVIKDPKRSEDDCAGLKTVAMVAKLGELFGSTQTEKNDWKERMLRAGLANKGLIMPDDWDTLDEDTKQKRLDGAIGALA